MAARKSLVHPVLFSTRFGLSANALNSAKLLDPILNSDTKLFIDPLLLWKSQNAVIKKEGRKAVEASFENVIGLLDISATEGDVAWKGAYRALNLDERPETSLGYGAAGIGADGQAKPHAHVMLTMREVGKDGFGAKVREWNKAELVEQWRERWADHVNQRLAELDIDARIDHRSLEAQGIALEPQDKIGPAASRMGVRGLEAERIEEHRAVAQRNGERIIANPSVALDAITQSQATFTNRDLAMFVHRHSDGKEQFDQAISAVRGSSDLIALGKDGRGEDRFTSRQMIETEQRLGRASEMMAERDRHDVDQLGREGALARAAEIRLSPFWVFLMASCRRDGLVFASWR